jgi:predicted nucleotidyltransferase
MIYTIEEITDRLSSVFEQNGVTKAVLFGSYAKGTATEESDVDIMIDTEPSVRGWDFYGIYEYVIEALGKEVDLVKSKLIKPEDKINTEVSRSGRVIYERN